VWSALHVGLIIPGGIFPMNSLSFRLGETHSQLGHFGEWNNILHYRQSNPDSLIIKPIVYSIYRHCYPGMSNPLLTSCFPKLRCNNIFRNTEISQIVILCQGFPRNIVMDLLVWFVPPCDSVCHECLRCVVYLWCPLAACPSNYEISTGLYKVN
jgi:hypothetical protein